MRLRSVDLPALGRPTSEMRPERGTVTGGLAPLDWRFLRAAEADFVNAAALRLEHFDLEAIELECLADGGNATDAGQHVATHGLEAFGLDLDAEPIANLV